MERPQCFDGLRGRILRESPRPSPRYHGAFQMSNSTWLITGASSGLGYALADHVLKQGDRVVLADVSIQSIRGLTPWACFRRKSVSESPSTAP
jgi:hypothetical protein